MRRWLLLAAPPLFFEAASWLSLAPWGAGASLGRLLFVAGVLAAGAWPWRWAGPALAAGAAGAGLLYLWRGDSPTAWLLIGALWAGALRLAGPLLAGRPWRIRLPAAAALALAVGAATMALDQLESGFSEEELFVALGALLLAPGWALLWLAGGQLAGSRAAAPRAAHGGRAALGLGLLALAGAGAFGWAYQASFFPAPPAYPGLSAAEPFVCEEIASAGASYAGRAVFERMLELVAAHPAPGAPEYGMLALGRGDRGLAEEFRRRLLDEAGRGLYSVTIEHGKYSQFEAARRAYYYDRVSAAFPGLFSPAERRALGEWFAAINRRALTIGAEDLIYGVAFGVWPAGPYENQEIGPGLIALLEATGLADPGLREENRAYLGRGARGWAARTRNSDDAYNYQGDWITNALFQSIAAGGPPAGAGRSFEWLLLQSLPDGAPLHYNYPSPISMEGSFYQGAAITGDPRYLWAAGRAATSGARAIDFAGAHPGAEAALDLAGSPPREGSCLLYGETGTPTRPGPLGPDKIVFREGWEPDDAYLLLNLRFTGWHRYKATNTVTLAYQGGPLVADRLSAQILSWMPQQRQIMRDKRTPRQDLNGLLIERDGISGVVYSLTGAGGPWAQDPPPFARVERFAPGAECDLATTTIEGWRGWSHRRSIRFCGGRPTVIVDEAAGPARRAAVAWNLAGPGELRDGRVGLRGGAAELVLVPLGGAAARGDRPAAGGHERVLVESSSGRLGVISLLLTGPWVGAEVRLLDEGGAARLRITRGELVEVVVIDDL